MKVYLKPDIIEEELPDTQEGLEGTAARVKLVRCPTHDERLIAQVVNGALLVKACCGEHVAAARTAMRSDKS